MRQLDLVVWCATAGMEAGEIKRARVAFHSQRSKAKRRGIRWAFGDFGHWLSWWMLHDWKRRGRGRGRLVMARHGDAGAYAPGNVYVSEFTDNARFAREQLRLDL